MASRFNSFFKLFKFFSILPFVPIFLLNLFVFNPSNVNAESLNRQNAQTLVNKIRQGGFVLYMRHTASNRNEIDVDTVNLDDCSKQRNLSVLGRGQARNIGKAFKTLNIPISRVITSPYCRCVETAQLAFGRGKKLNELRFTISTNEEDTKRLSSALIKLLSTVPIGIGNSVLVGHTGNLKEAAKIWPKPEGVIHIFKPLGIDGFKHLGSIVPEQWTTLK